MKIPTACAHCGASIEVYPSRKGDRNYCSRACGSHANGGHPHPRARGQCRALSVPRPVKGLQTRLEALYEPEPNSGCWLWIGALTSKGYGNIVRGRRGEGYVPAHKAMFELERGPVPEGLELDHLCRVRQCINPAHLEPVTHAVNLERGPRWAAREVA